MVFIITNFIIVITENQLPMKKLTKKNLKQLSETMTHLTKTEQRNCVGAENYYSPSGEFLGHYGDSHEIRVVSDFFEQYLSDIPGINMYNYSTSLFMSSNSAQNNVIGTLVERLGYDLNVYVSGIWDENGNPLLTTAGSTYHAQDPYGSYTVINSLSYTFQNGNQNDILCTLIHEYDHVISYDPETYDKAMSEYLAYYNTIHNDYFQYASEAYRYGVQEQYKYYGNIILQY